MITIDFDTDRDVMVIKLSGDFSVAELVRGYEAALRDPKFHPDISSLWDLTNLDVAKVPLSDVRELAKEMRQFMSQRGDIQSALVTRRPSEYHLVRIYLTFLRLIGSNVHLKVFKALDEAYHWIEEKKAA